MPRSRLRLAVAVGFQLIVLALVPWRQVAATASGRTITLRTAPVDPFDPLTGPFVRLSYECEAVPRERSGQVSRVAEGKRLWVIVERAEPAWRPVDVVTGEQPQPTSNTAVIAATWRHGRARLDGGGRFYLPQEQATEVEAAMGWRPDGRAEALVDADVDAAGHLRLRRIRVGDRSWGE